MKTKPASMIFLMAVFVGLSITLPTATVVGEVNAPDQIVDEEDDDNDDASASTEEENATVASAAAVSAGRGIIYVGPSASGQAVRILSTGYTLKPLSRACLECFGPRIVGPADLFTPWVVDHLKGAYERGFAIGLTNATTASIQRLHDLFEDHESAERTTLAIRDRF